MRIVFIGAVKMSERLLEKLIGMNAEVVGVVTKKRSSFNTDFTDLSFLARRYGVPYKYVTDINDRENVEWIRSLRPEVVFCFGFSNMLKKEILAVAPMGVVGFHPAKLPENRGRHPLIWALALGLEKTASTFFFADEGVDSGDILSQAEIGISADDDAETLYNKVTETAVHQIEDFLPRLSGKDFKRLPQDASKAGYWRKRGMKDGELDFHKDKKVLHDLVRALTHPYIGAHVMYKKNVVKVWRAEEVDTGADDTECGRVLDASGAGVLVKCCDGALLLTNHEFKSIPKRGECLT